jgi:hypothetical protein
MILPLGIYNIFVTSPEPTQNVRILQSYNNSVNQHV